MDDEGALRAWFLAVHPVAACALSAGPGAMISATTFWPSTPISPEVFELITSVDVELDNRHDGPTAYQRGSDAASSSLSRLSVRQGSLPTDAQFVAKPDQAMPSFVGSPTYAAPSGHGRRPGFRSPDSAAWLGFHFPDGVERILKLNEYAHRPEKQRDYGQG